MYFFTFACWHHFEHFFGGKVCFSGLPTFNVPSPLQSPDKQTDGAVTNKHTWADLSLSRYNTVNALSGEKTWQK